MDSPVLLETYRPIDHPRHKILIVFWGSAVCPRRIGPYPRRQESRAGGSPFGELLVGIDQYSFYPLLNLA